MEEKRSTYTHNNTCVSQTNKINTGRYLLIVLKSLTDHRPHPWHVYVHPQLHTRTPSREAASRFVSRMILLFLLHSTQLRGTHTIQTTMQIRGLAWWVERRRRPVAYTKSADRIATQNQSHDRRRKISKPQTNTTKNLASTSTPIKTTAQQSHTWQPVRKGYAQQPAVSSMAVPGGPDHGIPIK